MAKKLTKQEKWERNLRSARMIRACVNGLIAEGIAHDEDVIDEFSGLVAEWIFRNPVRHSGWISLKALNSSKTPTNDHYFGRKSSGVLVYMNALRGASVKRLAYIIASRSRCHKVTSEENTELKKHDSKQLLKPKPMIAAEYVSANIQMTKEETVIYIINGIEYDTLVEAAKANDCAPMTIKKRCMEDKRGKFPGWKYEIR